MTITDIVSIDKKRNKIYIDNEFAFVLYKGELHLYDIMVNHTLSEANYYHIVSDVLLKRAKLRAMNLLAKKDYTEHQLKIKLQQGYYSQEVIEQTLEYIKNFHYIDDERYIRNYAIMYISSVPRKKIEQKFVEKGIARELVITVLDSIYEEESELLKVPNELELGKYLLSKKKYDFVNNPNDRNKAYGYLLRHGISYENAMKLLKDDEKK